MLPEGTSSEVLTGVETGGGAVQVTLFLDIGT